MNLPKSIELLLAKGVVIPQPFSVEIGEDIPAGRISGDGVVLYPGTKIYGPDTVISSGVKLGYEGPVTIENCQLGPGCELKAGFFRSSIFLDGSSMESGAHVREGCLLEEGAKAGHTVGLKQTILFPFVTLGSLINFCDCLMAGGTDSKNHSEVGSGYVHFNYTPQQDKATASLIGDVPRGVMLREQPIFLGGQGGLVGPSRIGYGTVIAAGIVFRGDCPEGGKLITTGNGATGDRTFHPGRYGSVNRRLENNLIYLANLLALKEWYIHARHPFFSGDPMGEHLYRGAQRTLERALQERLKRLEELAGKMDGSLAAAGAYPKGGKKEKTIGEQRAFRDRWPEIKGVFSQRIEESLGVEDRRLFLEGLGKTALEERKYIPAIKALAPETVAAGERWLRHIVDGMTARAMAGLAGKADKP